MSVTKPQAVIRPTTLAEIKNYNNCSNSYKTASGNQAYNGSSIIAANEAATSYKTASGNQAYNPVARTRLTEWA